MRHFDEIWSIAAKRKDGDEALKALIASPYSTRDAATLPADRWLSLFTKCVFQAGFNWKVVESMWAGFEEAFNGFDVHHCAMLHDEDFERLVSNKSIVRHGPKIKAVQANAIFLQQLAREHDSAAAAFTNWPGSDYSGLLLMLKKRGSRLGGATGQYAMRFAGVDSYILSHDVTTRLIAEGIIDKAPTSQKAMKQVQDAFNNWTTQSGRSLTEISRVLAFSV